MPFIIGAYVLMWVAILVYVLMIMLGYKKAERQMAVLEEAVAELNGRTPGSACVTAARERGAGVLQWRIELKRSVAWAALRACRRRKVCRP